MEYLLTYFAALVFFIAIDLVWIKMVMRPVFERSVGSIMLPDPHMGTALVFFVLYQAGLLYFAVIPAAESGNWAVAALHGALIGTLAYGTYETTNLATIKGWTLQMAIIDVTWGAVLSSIVATIGYFIFNGVA